MAPKKITVGERKIIISNENHFKEWREVEQVKSLVDEDEFEVSDFEPLVDGGTYTLGPPLQQQQQQQQQPNLSEE